MNSSQPKVSVCMITYNHEKYIKEAIESVLVQDVNFDIELVLANDCSTDATHAIITELIDTNSKGHLIRYFNHQTNLGMMTNFIFALEHCQGAYIALCEGDDYWNDNLKLAKQVEFLEKNPTYGICFHKTLQINLLHKEVETFIPRIKKDIDYTIYDYIKSNKTATCSIVYRKDLFNTIPEWFATVSFGDLALVLSVLNNSESKKGRVLSNTMAVYRIHEAGVHGSLHKNKKSLISAYKKHIQFVKIIAKYLLKKSSYNLALQEKKVTTYATLTKLTKQENKIIQYGKYKLLWYGELVRLRTMCRNNKC
jgi:glycosyltransferase involved in cell wall biosynthesis